MEMVVLPAISFGLLPTKNWLREKEKEKSQYKEPLKQSVGLWAILGKLASFGKKIIKIKGHKWRGSETLAEKYNSQ